MGVWNWIFKFDEKGLIVGFFGRKKLGNEMGFDKLGLGMSKEPTLSQGLIQLLISDPLSWCFLKMNVTVGTENQRE